MDEKEIINDLLDLIERDLKEDLPDWREDSMDVISRDYGKNGLHFWIRKNWICPDIRVRKNTPPRIQGLSPRVAHIKRINSWPFTRARTVAKKVIKKFKNKRKEIKKEDQQKIYEDIRESLNEISPEHVRKWEKRIK